MTTPKVEDTRIGGTVVKFVQTDPDSKNSSLGIGTAAKYEPFQPIGDRLLIYRVEDAPSSKLGLPDKFRQATNKGVIVSVGDAVKSNLKPHDVVLFGEYNAERFVKDNLEFWIVREADIRGVERFVS